MKHNAAKSRRRLAQQRWIDDPKTKWLVSYLSHAVFKYPWKSMNRGTQKRLLSFFWRNIGISALCRVPQILAPRPLFMGNHPLYCGCGLLVWIHKEKKNSDSQAPRSRRTAYDKVQVLKSATWGILWILVRKLLVKWSCPEWGAHREWRSQEDIVDALDWWTDSLTVLYPIWTYCR